MSADDLRPLTPDGQLMRDIVTWDVRTWSKAVLFWEKALGKPEGPLRCLEIGAGPGGPSLWLALQGHDVLCTNWQNTEEQARPLHERYGVSGRIEYTDVDATRIPYENEFDLIVFKSVIGGVGDRAAQDRAMAGVLRALKPGGRLIFAENLRGTWLHRLGRAIAYRLRRASWRYVTLSELRPHLAQYSQHELHTTGFAAVFGLTEGQRDALAIADQRVFNRITPGAWQYVSYGTAIK